MKKTMMKLLTILTIALAAVSAVYAFPLPTLNMISKTYLRLNQVESETYGQIHVYRKNYCLNTHDCQCVMLIHGLGDDGLTWQKILTREDAPSIHQTGLHFFAVDLPGSGNTPPFAEDTSYSISNFSKSLREQVMTECSDWVVVGNSLGGWVAAKIALHYPGMVRGLMLENSAGLDRDYSDILPAFLNPTPETLSNFHQRAYFESAQLPIFILENAVRRYKEMPLVAILSSQQSKPEFLDKELIDLQPPTVLLWGDADRIIPVEHGREFAEHIPNSFLRIAPNCGHLPHKECPQEFWTAFNLLLGRL